MKSNPTRPFLGILCLSIITLSGSAIPVMALQPEHQPAAPAAPAKPAKAASKPKIYDEAADARQQIAAALVKAKKENRRVLIQWGGNWCPWCIRLHELFKSDAKIALTLMYEYDLVLVDSGQPAGKNVDLAKSYGADVAKHGFPFLTVLDADGKPIANQETEALEVKGPDGKSAGVAAGHNPEAVLKFLKTNAATPLKAADVLAKGLADAKASGKTAFVHFGAPWCGWCHRLEDWMAQPQVAAILAKDFVDLKIDVDRMTGGPEVLAKYNTQKADGIPWFVFVSGDGAAMITSDSDKGNIGFPSASSEIEHFQKMLNKARKNMTEADVAALVESLRAAGKKPDSAH